MLTLLTSKDLVENQSPVNFKEIVFNENVGLNQSLFYLTFNFFFYINEIIINFVNLKFSFEICRICFILYKESKVDPFKQERNELYQRNI